MTNSISPNLTTADRQYLPVEILEQIFKQGSTDSTQLAYALCLECSFARDMALPCLYSFVTLETDDSAEIFLDTIDKEVCLRPNLVQPKNLVLAIQIPYPLDESDIVVSIIWKCLASLRCLALPAFELVAISSNIGTNTYRIGDIKRQGGLDIFLNDHLGPRNFPFIWLATYAQHQQPVLGQPSPYSPFLDHITRLRLSEAPPGKHHQSWIYTNFFTSLTHIAVPIGVTEYDLQFIIGLLGHQRLDVIALVVATRLRAEVEELYADWMPTFLSQNSRAIKIGIVELGQEFLNLAESWEREMRGGECLWDKIIDNLIVG